MLRITRHEPSLGLLELVEKPISHSLRDKPSNLLDRSRLIGLIRENIR